MKRADLTLYRAKEEGGNRIATTPFEFSTSQNACLRTTRARLLPRPSPEIKDRRDGLATSQELLARICAVVDLLIASGQSEEHATHIMAQKCLLLASRRQGTAKVAIGGRQFTPGGPRRGMKSPRQML
jgi:hypothetical protein